MMKNIDLMKLFEAIKWAEYGDLTTFSETNYGIGWSFLGDDTPTVEDFNAVQQWNDKKDQWLYRQIANVCKESKIEVTETDLTALLKAIKKIAQNKAIVKSGLTPVELDLTNRAQIIAELGDLYKGSGRYYLTLHNSGAQHRLLNFPLGNLRGSIELVVSVMGGYSFLECYYLIANRRFYTHINWNNETLVLDWKEFATTATTLAGYGIADFVVKNLSIENLNDIDVAGLYGQPLIARATAERNYPERQAGSLVVTPSAYGVQQEYTTYSSKNKYVRGKQDNNWTAWKRIDGADWSEIRNPVSASTTQRGLVQLTNDTGLDSEMLGFSAKGGKKLAQDIAKVQLLASSKYTAQDASTTQKGLTQLNNSLTSTATNQALTAAKGKELNDKITVFKVPVKAGSMEVQLDLTNRAQIIAEIGNVYRGSGRYYLTFHNALDHHRLLNFPLGNARGAVELVVSAMGGFSFLECYYLLINRRFFTRVNWNSETLVLDWQEIAKAATTLAGYGITDGVKQQDLRGQFAQNLSYENATPKQLPLGTFVGLSAKAGLTPNAANGWSLISKGWNDNTGLFSCVRLGIAGNKFYYQTARDEDNWHTPVELANAESVVKKSGDEMTGRLLLHTNEAHGAYNLQHQRNAPVFVQAGNAQGGNHYYPYIKGRVTNGDGWTSTFSVGYTTPNGRNKWGEGTILLNEDNGHHQYWRFLHNGDFVSASDVVANNGYSLKNSHQNHFNYVQVTAKDGSYGGIDIIRQGNRGNWKSRLEALPDKSWKFWTEGSHEIFLPVRSGTVALDNDFIGMIAYFPTTSAPDGWLKACGAAVSRTAFAALFARIGTTFGAGDGHSTFNLPDLRGEFIRGWDDGRGVDSHRRIASAQGDAIKTHSISVPNSQFEGNVEGSWFYSERGNGNNNQTSNAITYNGANETRPRNIALLACIKY